jgi:hypothetical protein
VSGQHHYFGRLGTVRGDPLLAHFECTFAAGSPFVDGVNSDPGITVTRDAAGDYDVAGLPSGKLLHPVHMTLDLASDTPADSTVGYAQPRSCDAGAGTCKVLTFARDDGDQIDPPDGARLSATFLVSDNGDRPISSPLDVQGLAAWFADDVTGAGTAGFQVTDLSGNGNHGTQATTANQPTSSAGVLDFDEASSQHYDVPSAGLGLSGASQYALIFRIAGSADVPGTDRRLLTNEAASVLDCTLIGSGSLVLGYRSDNNKRVVIDGAPDYSTEHAFTLVVDGASAVARVDGVVVATNTYDVGALAAFSDAINIGGSSSHWDGTMRHVFIITGRVPTEAELRFLETYVE